MKYHSLPSLSDLKAYQKGKLSNDDRSWIDSVINSNPLVAEVFSGIEHTDAAAVQRVSSSVSDKIIKTYIPNRGFWSKYAGWVGLSSIVLILGSIYFFNLETISPKYVAEQSLLNIEVPQNTSVVQLVSNEANKEDSGSNLNETSNQIVNSDLDEQGSGGSRSDMDNAKVSGLNPKENDKMSTPTSLQFDKQGEKSTTPDFKEPDNTRGFESNESNEKTGTILLAVNSINILSKMNPDDFNTRSTSSGGNDPLGRGDTKRQNNASYSMGDLPSFPGGDQALINYFKGQLRPIEIPAKADKFDRSVMIELEVNSRGKLKDYKIFGNLHPNHQQQLEKAINELPQFDKGKGEKVTYSLAISF
jgi:hypothetical protein